jgi:glycosyltransferase involved in cell wall biosynthesis
VGSRVMTDIAENRVMVVIPAYNEELSVGLVIGDVKTRSPQAHVLVVDDASRDGTAAVAEEAGAVVLRLPYNLGVGGAMRVGFLYAVRRGMDVVVQVDADGQHDPSYIPELLMRIRSGADVAIGARFAGGGSFDVPLARRLVMRVLAAVMSRICDTPLTDATSGLRASNRRAMELFAREYPAEYLGDTLQSLILASEAGLTVCQIPVQMRPRTTGHPSQGTLGSLLYLMRCLLVICLPRTAGPTSRLHVPTQKEMRK